MKFKHYFLMHSYAMLGVLTLFMKDFRTHKAYVCSFKGANYIIIQKLVWVEIVRRCIFYQMFIFLKIKGAI